MIITITAPGEFISTHGDPVVGRSYSLEDATSGTGAQNRAFHALVQEYWRSGMHSYTAKSFEDFRNIIKMRLGAVFRGAQEGFMNATTVDGILYRFDTSGSDGGNRCLNCAATLNTREGYELCKRLGECSGGVWRREDESSPGGVRI